MKLSLVLYNASNYLTLAETTKLSLILYEIIKLPLILYDRKLSIILFKEKKYFTICYTNETIIGKNNVNYFAFDISAALTIFGLSCFYVLSLLSKLLVEDCNDNSGDNYIDVDLPQIDVLDKNITLKEKDHINDKDYCINIGESDEFYE
jgi:hypothetical protein